MQCPSSIWLSFCASDYLIRVKVKAIQEALHRLNSSLNRWKAHCTRRIIDLKSVLSFNCRPLYPQHGQVLCFYLNQVLNFFKHANTVSRSCLYQLCQICDKRHYLFAKADSIKISMQKIGLWLLEWSLFVNLWEMKRAPPKLVKMKTSKIFPIK